MSDKPQQLHWLVRPTTIRMLWKVFAVVLASTVLVQLLLPVKGYFDVDSWLGFGAVFGFLACLAMVLIAKGLGFVLKRDQSFYDEEEDSDA